MKRKICAVTALCICSALLFAGCSEKKPEIAESSGSWETILPQEISVERLQKLVGGYVNEQYGADFPGTIEYAGMEDGKVEFHAYEKADGHILSFGRYKIDPQTLQGEDSIYSSPVDFSVYEKP